MASSLQRIPFDDIRTFAYCMPEYKPDLCTKLLDCLVPDNMVAEVVAQGVAESSLPLSTEPIYGTQIRRTDFSQDTIEKFKSALERTNQNLVLPCRNEYIPTNFELKPTDSNERLVEGTTFLLSKSIQKIYYFSS